MTSDTDLLMSRLDEIRTKSAADLTADDIAVIIANCRNHRAKLASGEKVDRPKVDLSALSATLGIRPSGATKPSVGKVRRI